MRIAALLIGSIVGIIGAIWGSAQLLGSAHPAMAAVPAPAPASSSDWHATVRDLAAEHFKNPAWGYSHSMGDCAFARELAAADHVTVDDDVLFAAAYLHDMAAFKPWEDEKLDHSDVAAGIVDTVLKGTGFPMVKIDAVRGAIRTHMYYRDPAGPEALYLHDADALDWKLHEMLGTMNASVTRHLGWTLLLVCRQGPTAPNGLQIYAPIPIFTRH